jgi:hypothetical protein
MLDQPVRERHSGVTADFRGVSVSNNPTNAAQAEREDGEPGRPSSVGRGGPRHRQEQPADLEWTAAPPHPATHRIPMPAAKGRHRLSVVWEVPDPMPISGH